MVSGLHCMTKVIDITTARGAMYARLLMLVLLVASSRV